MTQQEFVRTFSYNLLSSLPEGSRLSVKPANTKEEKMTALSITLPGNGEEFSFCVENLYAAYNENPDMTILANTIVHTVSERTKVPIKINADKMFLSLVNYDNFASVLENAPYYISDAFPDMAVVVRAQLDSESPETLEAVFVTYDMFEQMGLDPECIFGELFTENESSTKALIPLYEVFYNTGQISLAEVLSYRSGEEKMPYYVFKNTNEEQSGMFGATALLSESALEAAAHELGGNFYIIPDCVHKLTLCPEAALDDVWTLEGLQFFLDEVNERSPKQDILSSHFYHYDAKTRKISMMTKHKLLNKEDMDR